MIAFNDFLLQFCFLVDFPSISVLSFGGNFDGSFLLALCELGLVIDEALALLDDGPSALVSWLHRLRKGRSPWLVAALATSVSIVGRV